MNGTLAVGGIICLEPFFGICFVDADMAYKYEFVQAFSDPKHVGSFTAFIGKLGHQLILNEFLEDGPTVCRHSNELEVIDIISIPRCTCV